VDVVIDYFNRTDEPKPSPGPKAGTVHAASLTTVPIWGDGCQPSCAAGHLCRYWFAHSNLPGSKNSKRWQDVHELLDAGIDVLTTMNVQHLESLNDQVWHFTGVRVRETIPDWVVDEADEVVLVDLTPRALRNRIERGVVYSVEKARRALDNFFAEANLTALRELAIRHTAHEVEEKLTEPRRDERILICLTGSPTSANLIRRGKRMADYLQADCLAVHISPTSVVNETVERHMSFARNLRIQTYVLQRRTCRVSCRFRPHSSHHSDFHGAEWRARLVEAVCGNRCATSSTPGS
jgi:hypothetical protein